MRNKVETVSQIKKKRDVGASVFIVVMLFIPILQFIVFWFGVNISSFLMAFKIPTGAWSFSTWETVFYQLGKGSTDLSVAIRNTIIYFVKDLLTIPFHLYIVYFLYKKIKGYRVFQIIFYLPAIISGVVMTSAFKNFIMPDGPIGELLIKLGVQEVPEFLQNSSYATWTILIYSVWVGWGGNMLLLGGALARIPTEILESARLDGVGSFREIVYIIFPLVWPTMSTLIILTMTTIFSASGPIMLFTQGKFETWTLGYWIFDRVANIGESAYNQVAATGLLFTLIGVPIILLARWLIEKIPVVEY